MRIIFTLLVLSLFYACIEKNDKNNLAGVNYYKDTIKRDIEIQTDSLRWEEEGTVEDYIRDESPYNENSRYLTSVLANGSFPFGSPYILYLPKFIKFNENSYNDSSDFYYKYIHIRESYNRISLKDSVKKPLIRETIPINLGVYYPFIDSIPSLIYGVWCKLPDMGPYQSFYVSPHIPNIIMLYNNKRISAGDTQHQLTESRSLILYDKQFKVARVINIYHSIVTVNSEGLRENGFEIDGYYSPESFKRLFYIGKDKHIKIYTIKADEETGDLSINNDFIINVTDAGDVVVKDPTGKTIKTYTR